MWCFAVSVGSVNNDSTVSVVSFDIAGTLKQKIGVALPAVSVDDPAAKRKLPFGSQHIRMIGRQFLQTLQSVTTGRAICNYRESNL